MTIELTNLAESMGWKLTIEVHAFENSAQFIFSADDKEAVIHPDVFAAATWLSGYAMGIEKATPKKERDQSESSP